MAQVKPKDTITVDTCIKNECITSNNGKYRACQQGDGNFVLYDDKGAYWANNRVGQQNSRMCMQGDGNLVGYNDKGAYWASNTNFGPQRKPYRTIMQDDGNLVIYDKNNKPVWASNTVRK